MKEHEAKRSFDITAGLCTDAATGQMHPEGLRRRQETFWSRFASAATPPALVLDVGCGTGGYMAPLVEAGYDPIGVDFSLKALALAKHRYPECKVAAGDIRRLPIKDHSVDAVLAFEVLGFLSDPDEAIKELSRVLRPNGRVFLSMLSARSLHYRLGLKQTAIGIAPNRFLVCRETRRLTDFGFTDIKATPIYIFPGVGRPVAKLLQIAHRLNIPCWPLAHAFMIEGQAPYG